MSHPQQSQSAPAQSPYEAAQKAEYEALKRWYNRPTQANLRKVDEAKAELKRLCSEGAKAVLQ